MIPSLMSLRLESTMIKSEIIRAGLLYPTPDRNHHSESDYAEYPVPSKTNIINCQFICTCNIFIFYLIEVWSRQYQFGWNEDILKVIEYLILSLLLTFPRTTDSVS